jgi:hypothetical protein
MNSLRKRMLVAAMVVLGLAAAQAQEAAAGRAVGTIKAINGNNIILTTDAGSDLNVLVLVTTRIVRVAPGQTSLQGATLVQFRDLQAGDRVLVRTTPAEDGKSLNASMVVLMKSTDLAEKKQKELEDWEKRGAGGLVTAVDPATGIVKLTSGTKAVVVKTTKDTIVRRYAPDSVKFEDAVHAKLEDIKPGDQLRARGNRNADGTEVAAEEIVAGTFHNVYGLITMIDPVASTITVNDLATKKPVTVKISTDSQLHKLPEMAAAGLAMRMRMARGDVPEGMGARAQGMRPPEGARPQQGAGSQFAGRGARNGGADIGQLLRMMPAVAFADLKKGEAVMIVATQAQPPRAITLLTGVEVLLAASPDAGMMLSPWSIGGGGGEGGGAPPQ